MWDDIFNQRPILTSIIILNLMKKLLIFIFCSLILTACEDEPEVDFNFPDDIIQQFGNF